VFGKTVVSFYFLGYREAAYILSNQFNIPTQDLYQ
jgi:hypothetical protein